MGRRISDRVALAAIAALALVALAGPARAGAISLAPIGDFDSPMYVTAPPGDPRLFVVERGGTIQVMHDGTTSQFLDITSLVSSSSGERGLQSMAFDPNYASNGLFYVFFTDSGTAGASLGDIHVDEFHVSSDPNVADATSRRRVLTIGHSGADIHHGGQLQFGKDGYLYVSTGEAGNASNAQTTSNLLGKILRIDPHGSGQGVYTVPSSNPFGNEIWALGLRNPFRFSFDHLTGDMVIGDVGQTTYEEIDLAPAATGLGRGANYGWPICEAFSGTNCSGPALTPPVFSYQHTPPCDAIIGGFVYRGTQIPELAGRYLYGDLCHIELRSMKLGTPLASDDRSEGVTAPGNVISFGEDASCNLYLVSNSEVDRVVGSGSSAAPACVTAAKQKCKKKKPKKKHHAAAAKKDTKKHKKKRCKKRKKKGKKGK